MRRRILAVIAVSTIVACGQPNTARERTDPTGCPSASTSRSAQPANSEHWIIYEAVPYATVQELAAAADVIVVGRPAECPHQVDESELLGRGRPVGKPGAPSLVYEVEVQEVLKGEPLDVVEVRAVDNQRIRSNVDMELDPGTEVLLYLLHVAANSYEVVGMDQGIFTVSDDGQVRPRAGHLPSQPLADIRAGLVP